MRLTNTFTSGLALALPLFRLIAAEDEFVPAGYFDFCRIYSFLSWLNQIECADPSSCDYHLCSFSQDAVMPYTLLGCICRKFNYERIGTSCRQQLRLRQDFAKVIRSPSLFRRGSRLALLPQSTPIRTMFWRDGRYGIEGGTCKEPLEIC